MPRYNTLESYYASNYLYENDASLQQQITPQSQNPEMQQGISDKPSNEELSGYNLRRAVLKLQEWVMYIDDKFPEDVDNVGGLKRFFSIMVDKMVEDEMIRSQNAGGNPEEDMGDEDFSDEQEPEIEDDDIEYEMQQKNQNTPQSFERVNKPNQQNRPNQPQNQGMQRSQQRPNPQRR